MCKAYRSLRPPLERNELDGQPGLVAHIPQYTYLHGAPHQPCTYLLPRAREVDGHGS